MIQIDPLWPKFVDGYGYENLTEHGINIAPLSQNNTLEDDYYVSWGENVQGIRHAVVETGFFSNALHLDSHGLYENCSLNLASARSRIESYEAPVNWNTLQLETKCPQTLHEQAWDGVVIAGQYHQDRSIKRAGSVHDYYRFIDLMCSHYGTRAFVKLHPVVMGNKEEVARITNIA